MRKKLSRVAAGVLAAVMIFSGNSVNTVLAVENSNIALEEEEVNSSQDTGAATPSDTEKQDEEETQKEMQQEVGASAEADTVQEQETETADEQAELQEQQKTEENLETPAEKLNINYFYLDKLSVYSGEKQTAVLSMGEGTEEIADVTLIYLDEAGNLYEWKSNIQKGNLFLFEKEFGEENGIYHFASVKYLNGDREENIVFSEEGMEVCFGVNCEYDGSSSSEDLEIESMSNEPEVKATVATIDENGIVSEKAEQEVSEALDDLGASTVSKKANLRSARSGNVVVVLDPGHDSGHAGARGNGVQEEIATLKIAQYCKAELEQYSGVTVYMTRTTGTCPFPETVGVTSGNIIDIKKRVQWAASKGADAFVSFHLDSAGSSAHGAHVYYPGTWFASNSIVNQGASLAAAIQKELVGVGLYNRGTESADYAVNTEAAKYGFPGLIIEHAFLTNAGDANTYLKTEAGLKKLGVADANGIVKCFGLTKGKWEEVNGKKYYYLNNKKVYGSYKIGSDFYYFDPTQEGAMVTGWRTEGSDKYYYREDGKLVLGTCKIENYFYCFSEYTGKMQTGFTKIAGDTYYYDSHGRMKFGDQSIEGNMYYFDTMNGKMQTGIVETQNGCKYYDSEGVLRTGTKKIGDSFYYFDEETGVMCTGFEVIDGAKYYYNSDGKMLFGTQKIENDFYYFSSLSGKMQTGFQTIGDAEYYYNSEGKMTFGTQKIENDFYYFSSLSGKMQTGFQTIDKDKYYYDLEGKMVFGTQKIENDFYYFSSLSGKMQTGFQTIGDAEYYYNLEGKMIFGTKKIENDFYYFSTSSGKMQKGFQKIGESTYYYDSNGQMLFGNQEIDGKRYYFSVTTGVLQYGETYYAIEGKTEVSIDEMVKFYKKYSPINYPIKDLSVGGASTIEEFATIYYQEAEKENIKAEIAWAQCMLETGWLEFGGDVKIEQFNFAGLSAIGGIAGADFSSYGKEGVRMGIRAQIQHLKAYADKNVTKNTLYYPCVDSRFTYVKKGSAPYVEWLGIQENPNGYGWAAGKDYGYNIIKLIFKLKAL